MRKSFAAALVLASIVSPAKAIDQSTFWATAGAWTVYSDNTIGGSCYAAANYQDGTRIRIGFYPSGGVNTGYIIFLNNRWGHIKRGYDYPVVFQFGTDTPWDAVAKGWSIDEKSGYLVNFAGPDLLEQFSRQGSVALFYGTREIANVTLENSYKAASALLQCQKVKGGWTHPPFKPSKESTELWD